MEQPATQGGNQLEMKDAGSRMRRGQNEQEQEARKKKVPGYVFSTVLDF